MKKTFLFHHHTRDELSQLANDGYAVVVPLAATEQHGPHLTVYTDSLVCEHISYHAVEQASAYAKLLLAPMLPIGCSDHHMAFGGTLSFSSATYTLMLKEIGKSAIASGFRKIIFLNGHGGNELAMHQAAQDLAVEYPVWTASASYWSIARDALAAVKASETGKVPGHAGGFETSLVLSLDADLVNRERIESDHPTLPWVAAGPAGTFLGRHYLLTGFDGYTDSAALADRDKGTLYLDTIVQSVSEWLERVCETMDGGV